ncbi:MAG: UrcA family protein [Candidatus Brevundimonas colombiensis]|uniref:UrcA family protein n=1 Tax=Candidatus Brevundimonas colombiensis TaxID=3121376 RepID=A0AAJ5X300_9CAUL|nr:UrcA family protein [Brevundimonas sp.]WEK41039.1 MAG: UrcA family protein [Brevundimonas sp.]
MFRIASLTTAALLAAGSAAAAPFEARIPYGDLDLSSRAGATAFDSRVRKAADRFCRSVRSIERPVCRNAVREEALALLPDRARADYARGRFAHEA